MVYDTEYANELADQLELGLSYARTADGGPSLDLEQGAGLITNVRDRLHELRLDGAQPDDRLLREVRDILDRRVRLFSIAVEAWEDGDDEHATERLADGAAVVERLVRMLRGMDAAEAAR